MYGSNIRRTAASLSLLICVACAVTQRGALAQSAATTQATATAQNVATAHRAEAAQAAPITAIIVRHAEKVDDSADPLLSDAGSARARALAHALADAGVDAIITTQYQRTRLTAAPLAEQAGLTPIVVTASGRSHAADVAAKVREQPSGSTVLVVGHSNTVPQIIQALGGPDVGHIDDSQYDNLFVVRIEDSGVSVIRARF